ncbi:unnamed protein product [Prorocentrum cordatum]|uniref:RRM domain-containing protein n=1 Tax=Prorocentrum cordatum TaxID=2364126 RepID=A0ABN9SVG0_9DINO|nr:unnamed protein product [Polarella glacialis]
MDSFARYASSQWIQSGVREATSNFRHFSSPHRARSGTSKGAPTTAPTMEVFNDYFETYADAKSLQLSLDASLPSMLSTLQSVTTESLVPLQPRGGESWNTVDEFDHPRGRLRAETRGSHPSEHAQQSAWVGPGGASSAAEARPPSQPGGVPLLHGQPLTPGQEGIPIWKSSGGESWKTVDEFDHPRGRLRAETRGSHPSEHAQQSAWVGLGGAPSAAEARPPSQPGGVPLLHGQPLPPGQEGIPIWKSSGGESWKTVDEFDHPRGHLQAKTRGSHPSEHAQQSAWVGLGGAPSAAEARPPSQPGGVPLLHGQPLPPGQEGIPIWKSSGGETWTTVDEFDHPRGRHLSPEAFRCSTASRTPGQEGIPIWKSSGGESWKTVDEFDHPRGRLQAKTRGSHPSEHAQQSAWVGLGGAPSAAEARPPSQPGGVPLLHGQPLPPGQEGIPIWKSSIGESWNTVDEFDHPRGRLRAETRGSHPSEHAQQSAWVGLGGAPSAAEARPPSQPGGVPLLHGQPLPPGQEGIPIWKSSGGETWTTVDEFDHPRGRLPGSHPSEHAQQSAWVGPGGASSAAEARPPSQPGGVPLLHGQPLTGAPLLYCVAGRALADAPSRPRGMPRRSAAEAGLSAGPLGEWSLPARSAHARTELDRAARAGASSGTSGAARTLNSMRARFLEQEQLLAEAEQQAQEVTRKIWEQEADLLELEAQQGELAASVPAPSEEAVPATPGAPAVTTVMVSNIPMAVAQSDLLALIDQAGFANRYDYAYMPITFEAGTTKGIAFVNFATPRDAREFSQQWNGARLTAAAGANTNGAVIEVRASALQGYVENTRRWTARRLRRMKNPEFHPFIAPRPAAW